MVTAMLMVYLNLSKSASLPGLLGRLRFLAALPMFWVQPTRFPIISPSKRVLQMPSRDASARVTPLSM
jgi:hypothetical protein